MRFKSSTWSICRRFAVLFLFLVAVTTTAARTIVWEGSGGQQLWLEASETQQKNRHPRAIPLKSLVSFFGNLYVARSDEGIVRKGAGSPLFSEVKAAEFAQLLAKALRKAGPNQDVLFQINDSVDRLGGYVRVEVSSAGRAFVDQRGYLNIIFGDIQKGFKERWLFGQKVGRFGQPRTGSRLKVRSQEYRILPAATVRFAQSRSGKKRQDWIIFDPSVSLRAETETSDGRRLQSPGMVEKSSSGLEERLRRLKRLRGSGLISEEIYRAEVRRLLKDL